MNTATFAYREIPGLPRGGIYRLKFTPNSEFLGMTVTMANQPEEAYAVRIRDFSLERWTQSTLGGLDPNALIAPDVIHFPTFDSSVGKPRMVPCFFYKPVSRPAQRGPFPVCIMVHGGPESQYWPYFSSFVQYIVSVSGIAVLAPNVRGSGGYGKTYLSLDDGYKREGAVKDIGCLLNWIGQQPGLDSSRIAVMGGSYGGYLTLASMIRFGGRIKAGIDLYGISNFVTFLEHTSAYRRDLRRAEYGDERDVHMRDFLNTISPLTNASRITQPLFIIQGANDPRVPLEESRQIADAVRKNKGVVWMLVANDEGHGYRKKSHSDFQESTEAFFLKTFLVGRRR
jgi:dipeptidyl aminopeptidase/acylaminoacyl peptidase